MTLPIEAWGIAAYFALCAVLAVLTRRNQSFSEYAVGARQVPAAMVFASLSATFIGPGFSVGFAGRGFETGFLFYVLALSYSVQTILVGLYFAPKLAEFRQSHTLGEVMRLKYGLPAHVLTGVVSVGLCIGFTAVMGKIAGQLLHSVTGWPIGWSIAIVTMLTALYTFTGGVRAVIANDSVQFVWFSLVVPLLALVALYKLPLGIAVASAKAVDLTASGWANMTGIQAIGIVVSFLLGETLIPPYANRALSAKNPEASRVGFVSAGLYCAVWLAICAAIGVYAHQLIPADTPADEVFLAMGKLLLPGVLYGALLAAVLAIVMSSQESVLNSASVALVRDVIGASTPLADSKSLWLGRAGTIVVAALASVAAQFAPSIIDGLMICYSIWAPTILPALLIGLYTARPVPLAGTLSIFVGALTSILWQTILHEPGGVPAVLAGLAASLAAYGVGAVIGRRLTPAEML